MFFITSGAPESPTDLHLVNSTHNSLTLSWKPGFDGGATAHFQIHYRELGGAGGVKHEDVQPPQATEYTIKGM